MKKKVLVASFMALVSGLVQANEGKVEFGFFDTAVSQAKKFEDAFRQNNRITGVNIDGRSFSLGGEWVVINSWSSTGEIQGPGKMITNGTLVLGKVKDKKLEDTMYVNVRLQPPVRGEWKGSTDRSCIADNNPVFSDVARAEDKYQSCAEITLESYVDKGEDAKRVERTVKGYAAAYGLSIQSNGTKMYTVDMAETKHSAHVYINRYLPKDGADLDELKRFAQDLRSSIRRSFFRE